MRKGLIFDLDGTLWDATEQMLPPWNAVIQRYSNRAPLTLAEIRSYMGKTVEEIAAAALPDFPEEKRVEILNLCCVRELSWLLKHPGKIYPGVRDTLAQLSKEYPLYIVSNCQDGYIQTFLETSGLKSFFTDFTCCGMTGKNKGENICIIMEQHHLEQAVYLGDTLGDYNACQQANVPFIHAAYGMGTVPQDVPKICCFSELPSLLPQIFSLSK